MVDLNTYQDKIAEFYLFPRFSEVHETYAALNLVSEVGELLGVSAKALRDGPKENHDELIKKEIGDVLFMVFCLIDAVGMRAEDVAAANIEKLTSRLERGTISGSGDDR